MTHIRCLVQAASNADTQRAELEARLHALHDRHYPGEVPAVSWVAISPGAMFTEGVQSTSSIISSFVAHETTLTLRERYLRDVCDAWTEVTGCTDHEIVATITELDPA